MNKSDLAKMRAPFPANQISRLPKPTKAQTDEVRANYKAGIRCADCGAWHHPKVVHLDYVGHAALTDRLLDTDPEWSWEPIGNDANGLPLIDKDGGLWIKLTVCGVTRLGYGDAEGKTGGNAVKERIGDALRNAAMRFGAALDLWHKGDLHADSDDLPKIDPPPAVEAVEIVRNLKADIAGADEASLRTIWESMTRAERKTHKDYKDARLREIAIEKEDAFSRSAPVGMTGLA